MPFFCLALHGTGSTQVRGNFEVIDVVASFPIPRYAMVQGPLTRDMRTLRPDFGWPSGFYDLIIRDEKALDTVRYYIETNAKGHKSR
jgi:hypothetical protein